MIVVDEFGNEYGATYPKRARGLVKSGRARFIDENRICLACPPDKICITEDIEMSENMNIEAMETMDLPEAGSEKYTLDYALEQIENLRKQITENSNYSLHRLGDAVDSIYQYETESGENEESRNISVACVCEIFRYREETLQRMLAFYEKMYDDLKPKVPEPIDPLLKMYIDILNIDKPLIGNEYRTLIMTQIVEYAEQLKVNAIQSNLDNKDNNLMNFDAL